MPETSVSYGKLEIALADAASLLSGLPMHDVGSTLQQIRLRSYILICHAAFEEYLEQLSLAVLSESLREFERDGKVRDPLLCACAYYKLPLLGAAGGDRCSGDALNALLHDLFKKSIEEHSMALDGVHGIKTKDQDSILMPVGLNLFSHDRLLSQALNSFGGKRGKYAHGLGFKMVTPRAGWEKTVSDLLRLTLPLDNMLCERHKISFRGIG
ncbi:HEPN domain-containing protein [Roseovarius sp. ZX-A-9]|uniref:HEPN domain-containing protein n=1 Tax=Roseovarius sp. ZX-A-9 TaxID=3014783 RepID=UPI00232C858D|nr:HEPN domain-containing protein [Roseovarius sp. ZX-A-9]